MKVYDTTDKLLADSEKSFKLDESMGHLVGDRRFVKHHKAIAYQAEIRDERPEKAIVIAEYPNGGKDVEYPIMHEEVDGQEAWDEYEDILRYIEYTPSDIARNEISLLQGQLASTDYISAKISDALVGCSTTEDIAAVTSEYQEKYGKDLAERQAWRDRINELEASLEED